MGLAEESAGFAVKFIVVNNPGQKLLLGQDFHRITGLVIIANKNEYKLLHKRKNGRRVPARYWLRSCKPNELKDLIRLYEQNNQDLLDNQTLSVNLIHNNVPKRELGIMQQIDDEEEISMSEKLEKRINPNLTPDNKEKLLKILNNHQGAFSKGANDMGFVRAKLCPITIDIGSENVYHTTSPIL